MDNFLEIFKTFNENSFQYKKQHWGVAYLECNLYI